MKKPGNRIPKYIRKQVKIKSKQSEKIKHVNALEIYINELRLIEEMLTDNLKKKIEKDETHALDKIKEDPKSFTYNYSKKVFFYYCIYCNI